MILSLKMKELASNQEKIYLEGKTYTVWVVKNNSNGITFYGLLSEDNTFFIPINGGKSAVAEYNNLASKNVEKTTNRQTPVRESFGLVGVIENSNNMGMITSGRPVAGITGIMFEIATHEENLSVLEKAKEVYPDLSFEPLVTN